MAGVARQGVVWRGIIARWEMVCRTAVVQHQADQGKLREARAEFEECTRLIAAAEAAVAALVDQPRQPKCPASLPQQFRLLQAVASTLMVACTAQHAFVSGDPEAVRVRALEVVARGEAVLLALAGVDQPLHLWYEDHLPYQWQWDRWLHVCRVGSVWACLPAPTPCMRGSATRCT